MWRAAQPGFAGVERVRDGGGAVLVRPPRLRQGGAHRVGPRPEHVRPLHAAGLRRLARDVVDLEQGQHAARDLELLVPRPGFTGGGDGPLRDAPRVPEIPLAPRLAGVGAQHALLGEVTLEAPQRRTVLHLTAERLHLPLHAEQLLHERAHERRGGEERFAHRFGRHPLPFARAVGVEPGVGFGRRPGEPLLELAVEVGEARRLEQVAKREAGDAQRAIGIVRSPGRDGQGARGGARRVHRGSHLLIKDRRCQGCRKEAPPDARPLRGRGSSHRSATACAAKAMTLPAITSTR